MIDSFTLADVRDWIRTLGVGLHFYIGKIDNKQEQSIGVYERQAYGPPVIAVGGLDDTKTEIMQISLLIHWNKDAKETDAYARSLYNKLLCASQVQIAGVPINYIYLGTPKPVDVGSDAAGVYERVIWLDLYYQRIIDPLVLTSDGKHIGITSGIYGREKQ